MISCAAPDTTGPDIVPEFFANRSAASCVNVAHQGTADLGFVAGPPGPGVGGLPGPFTVGSINGTLASVLTSPMGDPTRAAHLTLVHYFTDGGSNWFSTSDRAVCAPAGQALNVCRVNDVMSVVAGGGVFANASGFMVNRGIITILTNDPFAPGFGTLTVDIRGRVCGDGL